MMTFEDLLDADTSSTTCFTEYKECIPEDGDSSNVQKPVTEDPEPSQYPKQKRGSLNEDLPLNKKPRANLVTP